MTTEATAANKKADKFVLTPTGLLCFADSLSKPRPANEGGDPRWSCVLVFREEALKTNAYLAVRQGVYDAIVEKWGAARAKDEKFMRSLRLPFRDTSEKDYAGFEYGKVFINPWLPGDQKQPGIVDAWGHDLVSSDVFSGQLARVSVRPFAYDQAGNKGAGLILGHVQIIKADMPRLDGRKSAHDTFAGADNSDLAALGIEIGEDPTAVGSGDEKMPF